MIHMDRVTTARERDAAILDELDALVAEACPDADDDPSHAKKRAAVAEARRRIDELRANASKRTAEQNAPERAAAAHHTARCMMWERYARSPVPLLGLDASGVVREANDAAVALFGHSASSVVVGRPFLSIAALTADPEMSSRFETHLLRLKRREPEVVTELTLRTTRGRELIVQLVSHAPRELDADAPSAIVDVTDRIRLQSLRRILEVAGVIFGRMTTPTAVVDQCPEMTVPLFADMCIAGLFDSSGHIAHAASKHIDPAHSCALAGVRAASLLSLPGIGGAIRSVRTGPNSSFVEAFVASDRLCPTVDDLILVRGLNMRSLIAVPMLGRGETVGFILLARCRERSAYTVEDVPLAEEIARRAALAIENGILFRAQYEANESKDRFLAILSHELRTPLAPVLTAVSAHLERGVPGAPDLAQVFEMIQRNVELEARLIDDLLDITRITRGKLEMSPAVVDAHRTVDLVLDLCRKEALCKRQTLEVEQSARRHHVRADPARLQQVLWNLLKNAIKFTPEGGAIELCTLNFGDRFALTVKDSGIGIECDRLAHIFEPFAQADPSIARRFGGIGLGLSIARSIAIASGGGLSAQSDGPGKGAVFTLELPAIDPPSEPEPRAIETDRVQAGSFPARSGRPLRVLFVDDDADTLEMTSLLLETSDCSVTKACSVADALEKAQAGKFDIVVSDIGLPDGSGLELIRELRARYGDVKGIALSGYGSSEDIASSKKAGFQAHLTKPITFAALDAKIRELTH